LWVLADESLGTVPLALLRWPGSTSPLLYTTATSWITGLHSSEEQPSRPLSAAVAIVAAEAVGPGMPDLPQAGREPKLISEQLRGVALQSWVGPDATAAKLLSALSDPAAIVHIGAHGEAAPSLLGHAGVWLSASSDQPSDRFLSWLDIVDQPIRAGLVVLNACQLATNSVGSRGTLNFASSLSGVGASHVIAAFWPVSDAATAIWVPSFYAHFRPEAPESAAEALRQAQLALARSPRFSHPFHWASMRHFQRLPLHRDRNRERPAD
jgi:CHAT domain-containing protein